MTLHPDLTDLIEIAKASSFEYSIEDIVRHALGKILDKTKDEERKKLQEELDEREQQMMIKIERMIDRRLQDIPIGSPQPMPSEDAFPAIADLKHLYVQEFDNTDKIMAARAKKTKNIRLPFFQLSIRVNMKDEWRVPLHLSSDRKGRYKFKETLGGDEALTALDFDPYESNQIGVIQQGAVIACIDRQHRLRLHIHSQWLEFPLPESKQPHHADGAAIHRWSLHLNASAQPPEAASGRVIREPASPVQRINACPE